MRSLIPWNHLSGTGYPDEHEGRHQGVYARRDCHRVGATTVSAFAGDKTEHIPYGAERFQEEARTLAKFVGNPNIAGWNEITIGNVVFKLKF